MPVEWTSRAAWHYGDCGILLEPIASSSTGIATPDTFSRGAITTLALRLLIECVTRKYQYLGGKIKIGMGVWEVQILDSGIGRSEEGGSSVKRKRVESIEPRALPSIQMRWESGKMIV